MEYDLLSDVDDINKINKKLSYIMSDKWYIYLSYFKKIL